MTKKPKKVEVAEPIAAELPGIAIFRGMGQEHSIVVQGKNLTECRTVLYDLKRKWKL